jgi:hypothetical protein
MGTFGLFVLRNPMASTIITASICWIQPEKRVDPWEKRFPSLPFSLDQVKRMFDVPGGILFRVKEQGYYLLDNSDNSFKTVRLPADFQFISAPEKGHFFGQSEGAYVTFDLDAKEIRSFRLKDSLTIEGMVPDHEGNYWCLAGRKSWSLIRYD